MTTTTSTLAPEAARRMAVTAQPAAHPLADAAARLILANEATIGRLVAQRDTVPATDSRRDALTLAIVDLYGHNAQLAPYLPDGWRPAAVLAATCTDCGAGFDERCGRGCRERLGEYDD